MQALGNLATRRQEVKSCHQKESWHLRRENLPNNNKPRPRRSSRRVGTNTSPVETYQKITWWYLWPGKTNPTGAIKAETHASGRIITANKTNKVRKKLGMKPWMMPGVYLHPTKAKVDPKTGRDPPRKVEMLTQRPRRIKFTEVKTGWSHRYLPRN